MANDLRSSRYHRSRRLAAGAGAGAAGALLAGLLFSGGSAALGDLVNGSAAGSALLLTILLACATLPPVWYGTHVLDRRYGLSRVPAGAWFRDWTRAVALAAALAAASAELIYAALRLWPGWWWAAAAGAAALVLAGLTVTGPLLVLPLFQRPRPLAREALRRRLAALSARAGIPVPAVEAYGSRAGDARAGAALAGAGITRRILVSDSLLADYTDDEIEIVLAHEIGHHVHRHVLKTLAARLAVLCAGFLAAAVALGRLWRPLGLASPADVAGLPALALVLGAVLLLARPLLNALSRRAEVSADAFALAIASRPGALAGAVRRMGAQHLAEERPSRAARWLFHTHPTVEERIAAAEATGRRAAPSSRGSVRPG